MILAGGLLVLAACGVASPATQGKGLVWDGTGPAWIDGAAKEVTAPGPLPLHGALARLAREADRRRADRPRHRQGQPLVVPAGQLALSRRGLRRHRRRALGGRGHTGPAPFHQPLPARLHAARRARHGGPSAPPRAARATATPARRLADRASGRARIRLDLAARLDRLPASLPARRPQPHRRRPQPPLRDSRARHRHRQAPARRDRQLQRARRADAGIADLAGGERRRPPGLHALRRRATGRCRSSRRSTRSPATPSASTCRGSAPGTTSTCFACASRPTVAGSPCSTAHPARASRPDG